MTRSLQALFLISIFVGQGIAQDLRPAGRRQAVVIPPDVYVVAVVYQPECPLKIERARVLRTLDGKRQNVYKVYNRGLKAIRSFSIAVWNSDNTGDVIPWSASKGEMSLMPGQSLPSLQGRGLKIIPLTEPMRKSLIPHQGLRCIVFFMVTEVVFEDGAKYDSSSQLDALEKHLQLFETAYSELRQQR